MNLREQIEKTLDFADDIGLDDGQLRYLLNIVLAQTNMAKTSGTISGGMLTLTGTTVPQYTAHN